MVLEKVLAKLVGSYDKLMKMDCYEILRLLTPAPTVKFELTLNEPIGQSKNNLTIIK